jgi:hypothetical protein
MIWPPQLWRLSAINAAIERPSSCAFLMIQHISSAYIFPRSLSGQSTSLYFPRYTSGEEACVDNWVSCWWSFMHATQLFTRSFTYRGKYRFRVQGLKLRAQKEGITGIKKQQDLRFLQWCRLRILFFWVMGNVFPKFWTNMVPSSSGVYTRWLKLWKFKITGGNYPVTVSWLRKTEPFGVSKLCLHKTR